MPGYLQRECSAAFAVSDRRSARLLLLAAVEWVRGCRERRRGRRALLDYVASDYRAAADIGISRDDARNWYRRPFWRD
jgi:uncharacterized protein YjiS (DUF1127 family)